MKALRLISVIAIVIGMFSLTTFGQAGDRAEPEPQKTFTISGNVGIAEVVLNGLPGAPRSDGYGSYTTTVPAGFTGRVVPFKKGYIFSPEARRYTQVNEDYLVENYEAKPMVHAITGSIIPKRSGVLMQGFPRLPITNEDGAYQTQVEDGWSGTVTPVKEGHRFNPPSRTYENVSASMENQDYGVMSARPDEAAPDLYGMGQPPAEVQPTYVGPSAEAPLGVRGSPDVFVIPTEEVSPSDFAAVQEDMRVMNHILRTTVEQDRPNLVGRLFTDYGTFLGRTGAAFDGLYIQGYGAIFFIESDMLSRAALNTAESETDEQDDNVDPVWREARQQVLSPNRRGLRSESRVQTDPDEILRKLIMSLKHASNLHIDADERIIVNVLSQGSTGSSRYGGLEFEGRGMDRDTSRGGPYVRGGFGRGRGGDPYGGISISSDAENDESVDPFRMSRGVMGGTGRGRGMPIERPASMVTLQVEKRNVDVFAQGKMDYDTFKQSVDVFKY